MKNICRRDTDRGRSSLLAGSLAFFALVALDLARSGPLSTGGRVLAELISRHRVAWLDRIMIMVTMLGDSMLLVTLVCAICAFLVFTGARSLAIRIILHGLALYLVVHIIKMVTAIPRPQPLYGGASHWAFPSSHAAMGLFVHGLIARICTQGISFFRRILFSCGATLLILAIGFSRIYLGAHWPADILAGYSLGLVALVSLPRLRRELPRSRWCPGCLAALILLYLVINFSTSAARYTL